MRKGFCIFAAVIAISVAVPLLTLLPFAPAVIMLAILAISFPFVAVGLLQDRSRDDQQELSR